MIINEAHITDTAGYTFLSSGGVYEAQGNTIEMVPNFGTDMLEVTSFPILPDGSPLLQFDSWEFDHKPFRLVGPFIDVSVEDGKGCQLVLLNDNYHLLKFASPGIYYDTFEPAIGHLMATKRVRPWDSIQQAWGLSDDLVDDGFVLGNIPFMAWPDIRIGDAIVLPLTTRSYHIPGSPSHEGSFNLEAPEVIGAFKPLAWSEDYQNIKWSPDWVEFRLGPGIPHGYVRKAGNIKMIYGFTGFKNACGGL